MLRGILIEQGVSSGITKLINKGHIGSTLRAKHKGNSVTILKTLSAFPKDAHSVRSYSLYADKVMNKYKQVAKPKLNYVSYLKIRNTSIDQKYTNYMTKQNDTVDVF